MGNWQSNNRAPQIENESKLHENDNTNDHQQSVENEKTTLLMYGTNVTALSRSIHEMTSLPLKDCVFYVACRAKAIKNYDFVDPQTFLRH